MAKTRIPVVLLVEDNPDHATFIIKALKQGEPVADVLWAKDGEEGLDLLGNTSPPPDLILLDIHLPKLNGHDVLRRIKTNAASATIPVVMLTTSSREQDVTSSYDGGANSYIVKPDAFSALVSTLTTVKEYWLRTDQRAVA